MILFAITNTLSETRSSQSIACVSLLCRPRIISGMSWHKYHRVALVALLVANAQILATLDLESRETSTQRNHHTICFIGEQHSSHQYEYI